MLCSCSCRTRLKLSKLSVNRWMQACACTRLKLSSSSRRPCKLNVTKLARMLWPQKPVSTPSVGTEMTYTQVTQQQHVDAQTAAIQASAQAVAAQQHAIDTTANAAQTAATAMATQVTAPRASTSSAGGALPLPPSTVGVDMLDTAEQDPVKLSINWRALEQSLRLRAKNFSLSLSLSPTMHALKPAVSR